MARTTKRFPSSQCASAIQIVRLHNPALTCSRIEPLWVRPLAKEKRKFANEHSDVNWRRRIGVLEKGWGTLNEFIDRLDESIVRGDLPWALRNQVASLREQTEAVEAGFVQLEARIKELEARIKERERISTFSVENKANSRKQRRLKQLVGLWRRRKN